MATIDSSTLLDELSRLEPSAPRNVAEELRAWPRVPVRAAAELYPIAATCLDRAPLEVALRDLSWDGLGMLSNVPLEAGSRWRCSFLRDGHAIGHQPIGIVYCRTLSDGIYHVGGQFVLDCGIAYLLGADVNALSEK